MQGQLQQFASAPRAVGTRKKYREPAGFDSTSNIMHDKRVVRGSTCQPFTAPSLQDTAEVQKQRDAHRRRVMRASQTRRRVGTPEPVAGRKHMDMQTERYLEELTERTVDFDIGAQTDYLLDRPSSPLFMPTKIGVDRPTQIEEGDLFDFDVECVPLLEVLVGQTLEMSMLEVIEEEEMEILRQRREEFEKLRDAELAEVQRMEDAEKRRDDEKQRRLQQETDQHARDLIIMKKVVSRKVAMAHLSSLMDRTLAHLSDAGIFSDALDLAVDANFVPDLLGGVLQQMRSGARGRQLAADAMQAAVSKRLETNRQRIDAEKRRLAAIDEAEQKARDEKAEREAAALREKERLEREAEEKKQRLAALALLPPVREVEILEVTTVEENGEERVRAFTGEETTVDIAPDDREALDALLAQRKDAQDAGEDLAAFRIAGTIAPGPDADPPSLSIASKFRMLAVGEEPVIPEPDPSADSAAAGGNDGDARTDDVYDNEARPDDSA